MKKQISFLIISSMFVFAAFAQKQNNDWMRMKLKGKVRSVKEVSYSAIDKPGETQKQKGKRTDSLAYIFTNNGNLTELQTYNPDGSLKEKINYKYDTKGNKIEENVFNPDGSLKEKYTYKYEFYDNGNISNMKTYKQDGSLVFTFSYLYNDDGNMEENETTTYINSMTIRQKIRYSYNFRGNLAFAHTFNPDGSGILRSEVYTYDEDGNINEQYGINKAGERQKTYTYTYKLDKNLNWTEKRTMENNVLTSIIKRIIVYY